MLLHMVLLLKGGRFKSQLILAFRISHSPLYLWIVNALIIMLICLSVTDTGAHSSLCVPECSHSVFSLTHSRFLSF